jgi:DNA (cytosine-5)-methyltransferase 1
MMEELVSLEICAGGGGQALGLERAGFRHASVVEIEPTACATLKKNRPTWDVRQENVRTFDASGYRGIDLFAGGVPCPPFSIAGRQLGDDDDRDLFPAALDLISQCDPRAVLLENVPGLSKAKFADYRTNVRRRLADLQFTYVDWKLLNACDFGVPQFRPRFILVALKGRAARRFQWPVGKRNALSVGETLLHLMESRGWPGAREWSERAVGIAPTLVGGSKLHGGPDLGPTRSKAAWRKFGVDGNGLADFSPAPDFPRMGHPKLTLTMTALIQGFPSDWVFEGRKTAAYRQIGNAFPPAVAQAVGNSIREAIAGTSPTKKQTDARASAWEQAELVLAQSEAVEA